MRRQEIELRAERHDAGRVHLALAAVIVPLDVVHVHGRGDAGLLVEIAQIVRQIGIVDDPPQVALEVAVIDGIETDERAEQPPVGLGDRRAPRDSAAATSRAFELVERGEQRAKRLLVGVLRDRKAGAVDAVVDVGVDQVVDAVDLVAQRRRIVVGRARW